MADFHILDLATWTWYCASAASYPPLRGGVNAVVRCPSGFTAAAPCRDAGSETVLVCGGMHSDPGTRMPSFKGEIAAFILNLKGH